jgi:hypothetical protein
MDLCNYLAKALDKKLIWQSKYEVGAPILFAPKEDGTLRLRVSYRGLNVVIIKNWRPLPLIGKTLNRLRRLEGSLKQSLSHY